jgi:hypothetical protein
MSYIGPEHVRYVDLLHLQSMVARTRPWPEALAEMERRQAIADKTGQWPDPEPMPAHLMQVDPTAAWFLAQRKSG